MTTPQHLEQYADQINGIAMYAKRKGFDAVNGDYDKLCRDWLEDGRKANQIIADNMDLASKITKQFLKRA